MEFKMLIDKFHEIQFSYHKNHIKYSEDNTKFWAFLTNYSEKYYNMDKRLKKLEHLQNLKKIKKTIFETYILKNKIFAETSKTNIMEFQLVNAINSGKINKNNQNEITNFRNKDENKKSIKDNLFMIIQNIIKNPKNKNKINDNILSAYNQLEVNHNHREVFSFSNINNINHIENYYSPHFNRTDFLNNSNFSMNNVNKIGSVNNSNKCALLNSNNNNYDSNCGIDSNVITLNDINSANVSPLNRKNNFSKEEDVVDLQQDSNFNETEKSLQTNSI